jgi:hypothetical protein
LSTAYLQRLFEHVMPAGPVTTLNTTTPAGPSQSPVAEADQRLNDPDLANQFAFSAPPSEAQEPAMEQPPVLQGRQETRDENVSTHTSRSDDVGSIKVHDEVRTPAPLARERTAQPAPVLTYSTTTSEISSYVELTESVREKKLPVDENPLDERSARTKTNQVIQNRAVSVPDTVERGYASTRAIPVPVEEYGKDASEINIPAGTSNTVTGEAIRQRGAEREAPPGKFVAPPEPQRETRFVEQPEYAPRLSVIDEIKEAPVEKTRAQQSTHTVRTAPEPAATAVEQPAKQMRPMSAAKASIIGPLSPRRRAVTLFGLRRR